MNAVKTIDDKIKLDIALAAIKNPEATIKGLSAKFGVSESTVRRAKTAYWDEAKRIVEAEKKPAAKAKPTTAPLVKPAVTPIAVMPAPVPKTTPLVNDAASAQPEVPGPRGFRARNGRMECIRNAGKELGLDAPTADLYTRANELAAEMGAEPIKKSAFYVLICEVRRDAKKAAAAEADAKA
ncbi:hypothetical protein pf16_82 [Pseudomonas phage pf16]|uniref:Uncharacterized protein n=1 Tax=Pseudomonas phage pf16 TaxID=1815630 RepID=A0A1S5R3V7_9CAUD|nr:hypothetical protein FDG98_gp216 [Pseudomonas phage pf16]AND75005.1 hypothetical protein pf16_82 [Pseudomonas phage pf16]